MLPSPLQAKTLLTVSAVSTAPEQTIPATPGNTPESRAEAAALSQLAKESLPSTSSVASLLFPASSYVGGIAPGISDECMESILNVITGVHHNDIYWQGLKKWKRVQDAQGQPKAFGFAEFTGAPAIARALRLLEGLTILRHTLVLRVDEQTRKAIDVYELHLLKEVSGSSVTGSGNSATLAQYYYEKDVEALVQLTALLMNRGLTASIDSIEKRIKSLKEEEKTKEKGGKEKLLVETHTVSPSSTITATIDSPAKSVSSIPAPVHTHELSSKRDSDEDARVRHWEQTFEARLHKQRQEEQAREIELASKQEQMVKELEATLASFDDTKIHPGMTKEQIAEMLKGPLLSEQAHSFDPCLFYLDREVWRRERRLQLARERDQDKKEAQDEHDRVLRREQERHRMEQQARLDQDFLRMAEENQGNRSGGGRGLSSWEGMTDDERLGQLILFKRQQAQLGGGEPSSVQETRSRVSQLVQLIPVIRATLLNRCTIPWFKWAASDRRWLWLTDATLARAEQTMTKWIVLNELNLEHNSQRDKDDNRQSDHPALPIEVKRAVHAASLDYMQGLRRAISASDPRSTPEELNRRAWAATEQFCKALEAVAFKHRLVDPRRLEGENRAQQQQHLQHQQSLLAIDSDLPCKVFRRWVFEAEAEASNLMLFNYT